VILKLCQWKTCVPIINFATKYLIITPQPQLLSSCFHRAHSFCCRHSKSRGGDGNKLKQAAVFTLSSLLMWPAGPGQCSFSSASTCRRTIHTHKLRRAHSLTHQIETTMPVRRPALCAASFLSSRNAVGLLSSRNCHGYRHQ
jgi:hypothetical protein